MDEFNSFDWSGITYPTAYLEKLFDYAREKQPKRMLEIGFDQGASALAFLRGSPEGTLLSLDIAPCSEVAYKLDQLYGGHFGRHTFWQCDSREYVLQLEKLGKTYDLIFIDGDHLYDAVKQDIDNCARILAPGGEIILDDADPNHSHFGVDQAAREFIETHPDWSRRPIDGTPSLQAILYRV